MITVVGMFPVSVGASNNETLIKFSEKSSQLCVHSLESLLENFNLVVVFFFFLIISLWWRLWASAKNVTTWFHSSAFGNTWWHWQKILHFWKSTFLFVLVTHISDAQTWGLWKTNVQFTCSSNFKNQVDKENSRWQTMLLSWQTFQVAATAYLPDT